MSIYVVMKRFSTWFRTAGKAEFKKKYGQDAELSLVILRQGFVHDWRNPLKEAAVWSTDFDKGDGEGGFVMNVERKLHFSLRTGLNSVEARYNKHLILPGDFPYQGAGWHRGFAGGVSGLKEESDWWVFCFCVDKFIEMLEEDIQPSLEAGRRDGRTVAEKYLEVGSQYGDPALHLSEDGLGKLVVGENYGGTSTTNVGPTTERRVDSRMSTEIVEEVVMKPPALDLVEVSDPDNADEPYDQQRGPHGWQKGGWART